MNRTLALALAVLAANLALVLLFPPFDYRSALSPGSIATFDGFHWRFAGHPQRSINGDFLALEIIVVLINAGIAWLLLHARSAPVTQRPRRAQQATLALVAANLVLVLLFPPFENVHSLSKALLPSFDGFYFVLGDNPQRVIVSTLLYLEVFLVLVNGALAWLYFGSRPA